MEDYNASKIRDTIINKQIIYCQKGEYIFGVSSFVDGVNIEFLENGEPKLLIQAYDLERSKTKDKRPEFIRIFYYEGKELIEFNLLVDFDIAHIESKKIHLNYDYISESNLQKCPLKFIQELEHFEVVCEVNETEKTIIVDFEKTFISFLDFLEKQGFYPNFDKVFITKIYPSSDDFLNRVEFKLKEAYTKI